MQTTAIPNENRPRRESADPLGSGPVLVACRASTGDDEGDRTVDQSADLFGVPYHAPDATVQKIRNQLAQLQAAAAQYDAAVRQVGDADAIAIGGAYGDLLNRMASNQPATAFDAGISPEDLASGRLPSASELIDRSTNRR
jgi:hypothetical protein